MFIFLLYLTRLLKGLKGENKMYFVLLKFAIYVTAAGTGAAENWGGAGEHPRVCEDEEQPAQDQAGDRRRGKNHLKTSKGVWVWLIVRVIVGTKTSWRVCTKQQERVFGGDLSVVRDKLPGFSTLSCSFLQWGERLYILKTAPLPACLPARDCQYTPLLLTTIQRHTAPPAGGTWHSRVTLPFSELPTSSNGEISKHRCRSIHPLCFHSPLHNKFLWSFIFFSVGIVVYVVLIFTIK